MCVMPDSCVQLRSIVVGDINTFRCVYVSAASHRRGNRVSDCASGVECVPAHDEKGPTRVVYAV